MNSKKTEKSKIYLRMKCETQHKFIFGSGPRISHTNSIVNVANCLSRLFSDFESVGLTFLNCAENQMWIISEVTAEHNRRLQFRCRSCK
jgi:hypothetical protein